MISRRLLLGLGVTTALAPLAACGSNLGGGMNGAAPCLSPGELTSFDTLGGAPLSYAGTGTRQSFNADPAFVDLLEEWAAEWVDVAGLGPLVEVSTYGAHVDKCPSWHASGRAFDIAELIHEDGTVSCRYDRWGEDPARLRQYWRLAASLSTRFTYTLAYPYNAEHHNHLHVDNGVNGYGATSFRERAQAQTEIAQGVLRHVFGRDVAISGDFDDATREAVRAVQQDAGISVRLATAEGWKAFLDAAVVA